MKIKTKKSYGAWLGLFLGTIIFGFCIWGVNFALADGDKTLKVMIEVLIYLFLGIFLIIIIGAFNTYYILNDSEIKIKWGFRKTIIPLENIHGIMEVKGKSNYFSIFGVSWPGYIAGLYNIKGLGTAKIYGTDISEGFLYLKTSSGYYGLTPINNNLSQDIATKINQDIEYLDMDELPLEKKGKGLMEDRFYKLMFYMNIFFLLAFALYLAIFFPGSGAPNAVILLLVLAIGLFFFNISNAARLYQFSDTGGFILLVLGVAITGIFIILSLFEITF
ncbi:MAG: hypothetical protein GX333_08705 [Syntrophomonadaceae bacterium]|nr:hypothetical protein [Syntrophomonadaceae bacterium]